MRIFVLEIVSLLWSHPILTGLVILLFTTPLFHIVLFFTPLLMSTALCVIALISIGPQIEKIREERQFKISALNARNVAVERPVNRYLVLRQGRPQRPAVRLGGAGGRRWADWVKGIEIHGHTIWLSESHLMRDIAEEGLKADFTHEDGGIPMTMEDFCSNGAFTSDQNGVDDKIELADDDPIAERHLQLKEDSAVNENGSIVSYKQLMDEEQKSILNGAGMSLGDNAAYTDAVAAEDETICGSNKVKTDGGFGMTPSTGRQDQNRFCELVPVESSSTSELFVKGQTKFILDSSPFVSRKKKKKTSWFRRRRIPCLSKALGQLREKICSQIRRIFS